MRGLLRRLRRDRMAMLGLGLLTCLILIALLAPYIAPYPEDVWEFHVELRLSPPSTDTLLGTDRMGGDILSRVIFGARLSLLLSGISVGVALVIGGSLGLVAGFYRNWISDGLMRIADVFLAVPQILLAIAIVQILGPAIENVVLALSLTYWPFWARLVYAQTRSISNEVFVEAAMALGVPAWRVMLLHILPNIASPIIVRTSIGLGGTVLAVATLGFLGLGAPPPTPEWGSMVAESRAYFPDAWWYTLTPGLAIFLTVLGFNLVGDGLRDALDVHMRRGVD